MPTTLTVDNETVEALVEKLANDRYFLAEYPADHAAFILFYESNTIKLLAAAYGPQREDNVGDIHPKTFGILKAVVNNTWLDNREDQPGEPVAGVIQCDLEAKSATVTYHLGNEAEAWRFNDDNSMELRAALPPLTRPPLRGLGMPAPQTTDPTALLGRWELTGFSEQDAGHRSGSYAIIFRDRSLYTPETISPAGGETLEITDSDGEVHFSMRGGAKVPWTSAEKEQGVLTDSIEDQDGRIVSSVAPYLRMERLVDGTWVSKYSDSDLDMNSNLFTDGPDLILMVTTIVDELYVTKYFYRFSPA